MNIYSLKIIRMLVGWMIFIVLIPDLSAQSLSKTELTEDLDYLQYQMLRYHPNLFVYASKTEFDNFFIDSKEEIKPEISQIEAYNLIAKLGSVIKDGHTLFYPSSETLEIHNANSEFLPFQTYWDGEELFIRYDFSAEKNIEEGINILSINGVSSDSIIRYMQVRMMNDGNNFNYSTWVLNSYFNEYYSYFFGHSKSYELGLQDKEGQHYIQSIKGLSKKEISQNRKGRYPEYNQIYVRSVGEGIVFQKLDNRTGKLTIRDFHKETFKSSYQQNFKKEIKAAFRQIEEQKLENLIIDLRDNQGGKIKYGKLLLSFLAKEPFQIIDSYSIVDRRKYFNEENRLIPIKSSGMGIFNPNKNAFKGNVVVLINGGSFSNTAIVSSTLQKYDRATFIGEPTAGSATILAGSIRYITLPNSKISIDLPRLRFVLNDKVPSTVIPNFVVEPSIQNLIKEEDIVLESALMFLGAQ